MKELQDELKQLYALVDCPSDDGYWPEVQERINEIQKLIKAHAKLLRPTTGKAGKGREDND